MSRRRWCAGRPPVRFELDTGQVAHRVSWVRGSLVLHDHDLEAERVLGALGGEPCVCLALLDACREPGGQFAPSALRAARYRARGLQPWRQVTQTSSARLAASPQLGRMSGILQAALRGHQLPAQVPRAMLDVLEAAWEVRRQRQFRRPLETPQRPVELRLQAAVAPACEEAMRQCRRDLRPYATITVECWKRAPGEAPLLNGSLDSGGGALALSLPVSWLNRVWARGLALVDGHFVLEVDRPAPERELEARVIRWERRLAGRSTASAVPCQLRWTEAGWTLWW